MLALLLMPEFLPRMNFPGNPGCVHILQSSAGTLCPALVFHYGSAVVLLFKIIIQPRKKAGVFKGFSECVLFVLC